MGKGWLLLPFARFSPSHLAAHLRLLCLQRRVQGRRERSDTGLDTAWPCEPCPVLSAQAFTSSLALATNSTPYSLLSAPCFLVVTLQDAREALRPF